MIKKCLRNTSIFFTLLSASITLFSMQQMVTPQLHELPKEILESINSHLPLEKVITIPCISSTVLVKQLELTTALAYYFHYFPLQNIKLTSHKNRNDFKKFHNEEQDYTISASKQGDLVAIIANNQCIIHNILTKKIIFHCDRINTIENIIFNNQGSHIIIRTDTMTEMISVGDSKDIIICMRPASLAFNPSDNNSLIVQTQDGIQTYDTEVQEICAEKKEARNCPLYESCTPIINFTPNGETIVFRSGERTLSTLPTKNLDAQLNTILLSDPIKSVQCLSDNTTLLLLTCKGTVLLGRINGHHQSSFNNTITGCYGLSLSPDEKTMATLSVKTNKRSTIFTIKLWDMKSSECIETLYETDYCWQMVMSRKNQLLTFVTNNILIASVQGKCLMLTLNERSLTSTGSVRTD